MRSRNVYFFVISAWIVLVSDVELVRVCKSYIDYLEINGTTCYDNPESNLNVTEILRKRWNCSVEEYDLITDDGYKILVVRAYKEITHPTPIVIGHGIFMNSLGFLTFYKDSLVHNIIDSGRQVFLINFRGTKYSNGHMDNITQNDSKYWRFSFHQMAQYDIPEILKLVKRITEQKCIFIGYSMSSTVILAYASLFPEDAIDKLKGIITLATAVFFENSGVLVKKFAEYFPQISPITKIIWKGGIPTKEQMRPSQEFAARGPAQFFLFLVPAMAIFGFDVEGFSPESFPLISLNTPDVISQDVLLHYSQLTNSGKFRQFDFGANQNWEKYGTGDPPEYLLSNITVPVAQIIGRGDLLSTVEDARKVDSLLNPEYNCGMTILDFQRWTHIDFLYSRFQVKLLVPSVLNKITQIDSNTCKDISQNK